MPLILEQLQFSVDSSQLDEARIKIAKLGDAVNALNKPMQEMQKSSAKTAEAIARSELAAEKARVAKEKLADSASTVTAKVDPLTKLMEKLSNTYTDMAAGMTRGESSILNQARSYGAMGDQLKAVADILQNIKTLNKDPFDASLGGVRSITQEFERLQQRADLAAQGILMTTKQLGEYSKLAAEARGRVVGLGMDPDSLEGQKVYNQLLSQSQKEYLDVLSVVKQLTDAEQQRLAVAKEQERLQKAAASASAARMQEWAKGVGGKSPELSSMASFYKEQEVAAKRLTAAEDDLILREQKLAFVNKELAAGLTTASANALFKYQKDLEAIGETTDNITRRTSAFRAGLVEKQGFSPIKKIADDAAAARKEVDHLARALGPQITDIFVGLATGQSPLTILLQQGGQLRDQLALAGVESSKMGEALKTSASYMVTSVQGVAVAIGQLFGNAIAGAGKRLVDFSIEAIGARKRFNEIALASAIAADAGDEFGMAMYGIAKAFPIVVGVGAATLLTYLTSVAIAYVQVSKQTDQLTKKLVLNGGSLALTTDSAISYAKSMNEVGISTSKAMTVIAEMAKQGGFVKSEIAAVTESAINMQKYAGVAIEDTVKAFAKMKEEPVKALSDLARNTGLVSVETVQMVRELQEQGRSADATALAIKTLADVNSEQVKHIDEDYTRLGKTVRIVASAFSTLWERIKEIVVPEDSLQSVMDKTLTKLRIAQTLGITNFTDYHEKGYENARELYLLEGRMQSTREQNQAKNVAANNIEAKNRELQVQYISQIEKSEKLIKQYKGEIAANTEKINKGDANSKLLAEQNKILTKAIGEENKKIAEQKKKDNAEGLSAAKKLEDQRKKDMNVFEDIMNKSEGLNKAYNDSVDALTRSVKVGDITQQEYTAAFQALYEQQPGYIKQQQEMKKGVDDLNKSTTDFNNKIIESQAATAKEREELASMTAMLGMTEEQQKTYTIEYQKSLKLKQLDIDLEKELRAIRQDPSIADNPYIQYDREQKAIQANAAKRQLVEDQASYEIAKKQTEEFKKVQDDITSIIADALFEGGKKGADSLRIYLKTAFRNYVINVIINPIVGSLMGATGVQGASGSLLGNMGSSLLSNAVTGISGVASAFGTAFSNAALSTVQGWVGMSGTAAQMGTSLANAGYFAGSAAGTTASGIGASIGAYAPYALAAVVALDQLGILDRWGGDPDAFLVQQATGTTQRYRTSTTSRLGTVGFVDGNAIVKKNGKLVSDYGETEDVSGQFQNAALATIQALDNAIAANMSEQQIRETSEMLSGWFKKSWSFSGGMLEGWLTSRYELILQSLDSTFGKVKDYQKEGEKLTDTTVRLITNLTTVKNTFDSLGISADLVTAKFATNLADMLGGISNFSSSMQFFYENFFSEEEKMQRATEGLTKAFAAMNLTVPETKDQFRALLEGALSSGNIGLSASLMALMQPFNDFIAANEELAQSVNDTVNSIQEEINRLRAENLTDSIVQGTALRAEFDIMSALARGGDITALAKLPEYSQAIEKNMTDFASSASDVIFARALLAQSLSDTMSSLGGNTTIVPTSVSGLAGSTSIATTGAADLTASVTSQGDLVSVLIAEIQGLRAEVRADVSANTKTSKILERANQDGETLSVTVVA